jgi:hypothetical protein
MTFLSPTFRYARCSAASPRERAVTQLFNVPRESGDLKDEAAHHRLAPSPNATRRWRITRTGVTWSGWSIRARGDREEHANTHKLRSAFMATPTQKF